MIHYPSYLKSKEGVAISAMSMGADSAKLDAAIQNIQKRGFFVLETPHVRNNTKLVSCQAITRVEEFMSLWQNESVSHILAARGGEFLMETLPLLEEKKEILITTPPKWVQGYSDISLLCFYLTTNCSIATIHAANLGSYAMDNWHTSIITPLEKIASCFTQYSYVTYEITEYEDFRDGYHLTDKVVYESLSNQQAVTVKGRIIGGCIESLLEIIGTKFDHTKQFCDSFKEGMIWYLDNYSLDAPSFYRAMWTMKQAGWFTNCNAILIGRTAGGSTVGDFTYLDALHQSFDDMAISIIYDVDIGHLPPQLTMINGSYATVEYQNGKIALTQQLI